MNESVICVKYFAENAKRVKMECLIGNANHFVIKIDQHNHSEVAKFYFFSEKLRNNHFIYHFVRHLIGRK